MLFAIYNVQYECYRVMSYSRATEFAAEKMRDFYAYNKQSSSGFITELIYESGMA